MNSFGNSFPKTTILKFSHCSCKFASFRKTPKVQCAKKNGPPPGQIYSVFDQVSNQFLKFLTEQVKSKLFCARCKYTVSVKMIKNAVEMV